mgnify:CR=1 FL=1
MKPSALVLDTSAYSHFRLGHDDVLEHMSLARVIYVPTVVIGELEAGFLRGTRYRENTRSLSEFLQEPFVVVHNVDIAVAQRYGQLVAALRRAGTPIPTNDIWIAATALACGGHLLTFDRDFARVEGLAHVLLG